MTKIIFVSHDGTRTEVDANDGDSIMQTAVAHDVDGIIGECGGSMMCATCHCYVDEAWTKTTGNQEDGEDEMLDCAASEVKPTSRLSCQVKVTKEMDGAIIHIPEDQI